MALTRSEATTSRMIFYAAAIALSLSLMGPASADVRIISSSGGVVDPYLTFFSQLRRSGQRVIIDGPCAGMKLTQAKGKTQVGPPLGPLKSNSCSNELPQLQTPPD